MAARKTTKKADRKGATKKSPPKVAAKKIVRKAAAKKVTRKSAAKKQTRNPLATATKLHRVAEKQLATAKKVYDRAVAAEGRAAEKLKAVNEKIAKKAAKNSKPEASEAWRLPDGVETVSILGLLCALTQLAACRLGQSNVTSEEREVLRKLAFRCRFEIIRDGLKRAALILEKLVKQQARKFFTRMSIWFRNVGDTAPLRRARRINQRDKIRMWMATCDG